MRVVALAVLFTLLAVVTAPRTGATSQRAEISPASRTLGARVEGLSTPWTEFVAHSMYTADESTAMIVGEQRIWRK